jgi:hypothetical protein
VVTSEPHPKWVDYVVRTRQSFLRTEEINQTYLSKLKGVAKALAPSETDPVKLFPIAHEDQTAFLIHKEGGAAIFFDVGQSAVLKSAFAGLRAADPLQTVFRLFVSTASLKISPRDGFLADKLGDVWSGPYDGPPFVDQETLNSVRGALFQYAVPGLEPVFESMIDIGIIAHEVYHYRVRQALRMDHLEQVIAAHYDQIVQVATEGTGPLGPRRRSKEERRKFERELQARREYYLAQRSMISEEIACDLYAFSCVVEIMLERAKNEREARGVLEIVLALNSIAFNFHLLHLAFTERAQLFVDGQANADLPGSMSLYNLRRVALGILSSYWSAGKMEELNPSLCAEHDNDLSQHFQVLENRIYIEMANSILMPAIPMLKGCFALLDRTFPVESRPALEPAENGSERLFYSSLAFRLDQGVLDRMLKSGRDTMRQRMLPFVYSLSR